MWRFVKLILLIPCAAIIVVVAMANRQVVPIFLDPTGKIFSDKVFEAPLFLVFFAAIALGVLLGGVGSWFAHGHYRRKNAHIKRELEIMKYEADHKKVL